MTFSVASTMLLVASLGVLNGLSDPAQTTGSGGFGLDGLLQYGAIGLVCAWLMIRVETRLKDVERAIDRSTRANLVVHLAREDISDRSREEAQQILREVEGEKRR